MTVLGRSGRPIILGPVAVGDRLRAAVLDSVPDLGQGLRQLRSRAARRRVARRRGAVVSAHHAALRGHLLVLHARRVPRRATSGASSSSGGRQKHIEISSFDREILARVQAKRGLQRRRAAASVADVPAVRPLLAPAHAGDAVEAFSVFAPLPAPPTVGHPARSCPSGTSPRSSTATWRCRRRRRTARS